ncbi:Uroporphyrinogen-III synthase [Buchnera aphidicola (Eriosoma lanigerum)]|uniref:uroporphyrinogen-III synthase n=1 Tax=Buchnera aphidicola TaxID=9 RepID=UPI003464D994
MKILITRPHLESIELQKKLRLIGISAWSLPILNFYPGIGLKYLSKIISTISKNSIICMTSKKAIEYASMYLKSLNIPWPSDVQYYTIGKESSLLFQKKTGKKSQYPILIENSENLLKLIDLKIIKKKTILILKGNQGRNILKNAFITKGANVILIECYKRKIKKIDSKKETKKWKKKKIDTIVVTNSTTLHALYKIFSSRNSKSWFLQCNLLVISIRLKILAKNLGWDKIYISKKSNNNSLLEKLLDIKKNEKKDL